MKFDRVLILILIGWYLSLAWGHYFNQRPLWNDELCVLNSIIHLKPAALFSQPLLGGQSFPRVYLWAVQQFSNPFDQHLLSLRLFSLLAMIGAFFVWLKISRRVLSHLLDQILFIGCWGASMPLVYYAAELKPYSMDVLAAGLIVLFLISQDELQKEPHLYRTILLLLPLLALWSYPTIFLLWLPLYHLIRSCIYQRRSKLELLLFSGCFAGVLGVLYFFDFRHTVSNLLEVYWHDYFISFKSMKDFLGTLGKGMNNLIGRRFAESPRWVKIPSRIFIGFGVGYMLLAFWDKFKTDRFILRSIISLAFVIFVIQLILAVLRIYPFAVPRMSLFFTPLLLIMTIMALRRVHEIYKPLGIMVQIIFAGYLIFVSSGIAWNVFFYRNLGAESTLFSSFR